jgi:hypothetical protein
MTDRPFSAEEIDTSRPHPARMYDYYLGGKDNYEVDREAAEQVIKLVPDAPTSARANRDFMHRAVRTVVSGGIRQIIDIGTGIPTSPNTHEVARGIDPGVKVAYVDNDPIVSVHAGAKLTNTGNTGFVLADLRDPQAILDHQVIRGLIDFDQPVALMLISVLHFITQEEDPIGIIATLSEAFPAGSALIVTHATADLRREEHGDARDVYKNATVPLTVRTRAEVEGLFRDFDLVEPGVVQLPLWRPDGALPTEDELARVHMYGGVGYSL